MKHFQLSKFLELKWILILITVTYFVVYFNYPATPGNNPDYPLGWWGWFDQGQYQLSADALSKWDLSREKHFYPPLYPAIGAALIKLSAGHVYWSVNLICLLWFSYVFIRLSDNYVRRWVGVFLLFSSVIFNRIIFENFIIPWTSTLSAALIATGILGLVWFNELKSSSTKKISGWQVIVLSTSLGLLAAVRPIDAVAVGVVIAVALIIIYWQFRTEDADRVPSISRVLILVTLGASIGPIIFLVFNYGVYGELMGRYFNVANSNGYYFSDLPEKFVSIWLDSKSLYREENAALIDKFPWLVISFAGFIYLMFKGDYLLRTIAISMGVMFLLYLPYGDLIPNGMWRYLNIHYFKWTFPFFALFGWFFIERFIHAWRRGEKRGFPTLVLFGTLLVFFSLRIETRLQSDINVVSLGSDHIAPIILQHDGEEIDFLDIKGLRGGFNEVYFGEHEMFVNGVLLKRVKEYRVLPNHGGIRVLFIRPKSIRLLQFKPDQRLKMPRDSVIVGLGVYDIAFNPTALLKHDNELYRYTAFPVGGNIDFSETGNSWLYATDGWSHEEKWGRWSQNEGADIKLKMVGNIEQELILRVNIGAFVNTLHPKQKVDVVANGLHLTSLKFVNEDAGIMKSITVPLSKNIFMKNKDLHLKFITKDSISPLELGVSTDSRVLGVAIQSISILPRLSI